MQVTTKELDRFADMGRLDALVGIARSSDYLASLPAPLASAYRRGRSSASCDECGGLPAECDCVAFTRDPIDPSDV